MKEETKESFLLKNLLRGLLWFAVIITVFILAESYIQENFKEHIDTVAANSFLLYGIYTLSEIIFGILPPELFMMIWILDNVSVSQYILNLTWLTLISYAAGVLGYFIGYYFTKTPLFKKIYERYLKPYEGYLKKYGGFLVVVGAVTPVPYSATCMLAGSVHYPFKTFLLLCITRIIRFSFYGWMVWTFPNWFNG
ncbi:MAG TPA: VTT domain-containing protein [Cyclobacteriaceae bacterium]